MRVLRLLGVLCAICALAAIVGNAAPRALASVSLADISSAGPLTNIQIGIDLSCQVEHTGDTDLEFYPPSVSPGDCGTMLSVNGSVYRPDFESHDGTATGNLTAALGSEVFTPVSQTGVTGAGTAGDPYQVITVADAGATGLRLTETDTYVVGQESYRTDLQIQNTSNGSLSVIVYRAGDCYLGGDDHGYGLADAATKTVACTVNANNSPPARIEQWSPITPADHYVETTYAAMWALIGTGNDLPDTCQCADLIDNAAAVNWDRTIPAGDSVTVSHLTTFSPVGTLPLVVTKTADAGTADPGAQDGYTISISNPNVDDITAGEILDVLPAGFSYLPGTTTGATTNDPTISSQQLTWTGPFNIPGDGEAAVTLHFNVTVSDEPGIYTNSARVNGADAVPAVDVAPITVNGEGSPTASATATFTATATAECGTATSTATETALATVTAESTHTAEATHTAETTSTVQATHTAEVTSTVEIFSAAGIATTAEATHTAEVTRTAEATHTAETTSTAGATRTVQATHTAAVTETSTAETDTPTPTDTAVATATSTETPTSTATACVTPGVQVHTATPTATTPPGTQATNTPPPTATDTPVSGVLGEELPPGVTSGTANGPSALPNSGDGTTRRNVSVLVSIAALLAAFGGLFAVVAYERRRSS